jgi:hypothetical protein
MDPNSSFASPAIGNQADNTETWSNASPGLMSPVSNVSGGSSIPRRRSTAPTRSHFARRSEDATGIRRDAVISGVDIRQVNS